ncbi:hypothetical protein RI129_002518 [Pyrocoelia pectoralis]|uniref:ARID domain-containing protein n=1 Tax=Pyrocoelia pectoralis TaxID=417401 RepID=A0AAN7VM28_9COLE
MQGDDPPYLSVGTAVSAKYKGAFCEAKVSKVVRVVKCKVTYKMGLGTATVSDEQIKGPLRVGQVVQAKHSDKKEYVEATISKIQDCSQYTVVFDDGDITTLRRTALCLKSGRHFNESETLDQLPLTHPEHFGNPVVGGRRGRRSRQEDSSEGEVEEENEPDLEVYTMEVGRVVCVEASDKKRNKDNWFPGLVVMPSAQPTVRINVKDEFLVRSFKDGRYYTVPQKEVSEFSRDMASKIESTMLVEAVEKVMRYLDNDELPVHWERSLLFHNSMQTASSDSDEHFTDSSEDETPEEKDHFVAQLYKFMDDSNTPLNKSPMIGSKDVDLHKLFGVVRKLGGYNRVTNKNKWRSVTLRLKLPNNLSTHNQVKLVYKKCLLSYEAFHRTLGVTMLNHPRNAKKSRGRSLIRDKDRSTPINSPRPDKEEEVALIEKREEEKPPEEKPKPVPKKVEAKPTKVEDEKKIKDIGFAEISDTNSSSDTTELVEVTANVSVRLRRTDSKAGRERKPKPATGEKVKTLIEKFEEHIKKRRKKKRSCTIEPAFTTPVVSIGDKLKVFYGPTNDSKVTYEAKVIEIDKDAVLMYLVHYTGWNTRYDEWITPARIAENLSATTKAKKLKQSGTSSTKVSTPRSLSKRGRRMSITGRSSSQELPPRSTTPSSITSTSSRTKSPATPIARGYRTTRLGEVSRRTRRTSGQTDISNHSESESDGTESESDMVKTRSGVKSEDNETRLLKKKAVKSTLLHKMDKRKDEDTEKAEEDKVSTEKQKGGRKTKKNETKSRDSDEDSGSTPKGRDFDLNQIRSELKGFAKAVKVASTDTTEKEANSSDESSNVPDVTGRTPDNSDKDNQNVLQKSPTSDDIYEFKEPEPFEFETRTKLVDEKNKKRLVPRIFEDLDKSPSKRKNSPIKNKDEIDPDKKRLRRIPLKKSELLDGDDGDDDDDEDEESDDISGSSDITKLLVEDPFDKLVESPSFHSGKEKISNITLDEKHKAIKNLALDEPLSLFHGLTETREDDSGDQLDISDVEESQNEPLFTHKEQLFSEATFSKSPDDGGLDPLFRGFMPKIDDRKQKDSDDDDASIRASIQSVINQGSSSDDDSNHPLLIIPSFASFQDKVEEKPAILSGNESEDEFKMAEDTIKSEAKETKIIVDEPSSSLSTKHISPALQETESTLLETICTPTEILTKLDETKDINIKTGTKIADSLLQKFSMIKNDVQEKTSPQSATIEEESIKIETVKTDKGKMLDTKVKSIIPKPETFPELKKRSRKIVSREFILESDTDSTDSEERLIIARSDDESQTNSSTEMKEPNKLAESTQSHYSFKFDTIQKTDCNTKVVEKSEDDIKKEEEPDSHLHSLLLCEETIPGSPAPASEGCAIVDSKPSTKSVLEMPFASAPGSSNNKPEVTNREVKVVTKERSVGPPLLLPVENREKDPKETSTVLDNTPPTTPESTLSNFDLGDLSNTGDNESCKSIDGEGDFSVQQRCSSNKISLYSEDGSDDVPIKRGRKPTNRSRHNSDSDDTSEHSIGNLPLSSSINLDTRLTRSPKPSKYNFYVELDPSLDSAQRIAILQQKLQEIRKTYADVKAELAAVERRRKKLRRREREAKMAAKQELVVT